MKKLGATFAALILGAASFAQELINESQKNSLAMLNYLTATTIEIQKTSNSKLYLDKIANELRENTDSKSITKETDDKIRDLTLEITELKILSDKRKQIQFLYENEQSQAIKKAIPNPLFLLSAVQSGDIKKTLVSIGIMAIDSVAKHADAKNQAQIEFLKQGWELDEKEMRRFDSLMDTLFTYKNTIINQNEIPSELALNKYKVDDYVKYKTSDNLSRRQIFLEENENVYRYYAPYWLERADVYYNLADKENSQELKKECYRKVVDCFKQYQAAYSKIFLKDYGLANAIPELLVAAEQVMSLEEYEAFALPRLQFMLDNSEESDWYLRYMAAQMYIDLAARTGRQDYLQKAYEISRTNVNFLIDEQKELMAAYLAPIPETDKDSKIPYKKEYIKQLKKRRKTELPPLSESLILNCDLMTAIADKINISSSERDKIRSMLSGVFLNPAIENIYKFSLEKISGSYSKENLKEMLKIALDTKNDNEIEEYLEKELSRYLEYYNISEQDFFNYLSQGIGAKGAKVLLKQNKIYIPSIYMTENSSISVSIRDKNGNITEEKNIEFEIKNTERDKRNSIGKFMTTIKMKSTAIKDYKFNSKESYIISINIETLGKESAIVLVSKLGGFWMISDTEFVNMADYVKIKSMSWWIIALIILGFLLGCAIRIVLGGGLAGGAGIIGAIIGIAITIIGVFIGNIFGLGITGFFIALLIGKVLGSFLGFLLGDWGGGIINVVELVIGLILFYYNYLNTFALIAIAIGLFII